MSSTGFHTIDSNVHCDIATAAQHEYVIRPEHSISVSQMSTVSLYSYTGCNRKTYIKWNEIFSNRHFLIYYFVLHNLQTLALPLYCTIFYFLIMKIKKFKSEFNFFWKFQNNLFVHLNFFFRKIANVKSFIYVL